MKTEKLEKIIRMIFLENKIFKLKYQYPELQNMNMKQKLSFLYDKIDLESTEQLTFNDVEYLNIALLIPFEEVLKELNKYDNSSPKMDEIEFIETLSKKYNMDRFIIIKRIKDIRKINKVLEKNEKNCFFAIPCNKSFVVSKEKTDDFLNKKPDKKIIKNNEEFLKKINISNETDIAKILKKTKK